MTGTGQTNPETPTPVLGLDASRLQSLWHDLQEQYNFSINLRTPHAYQSNPLTWLLEIRPTAFWYTYCDSVKTDCPKTTGNVLAILPLGNPYIWFRLFLPRVSFWFATSEAATKSLD
jgi:hypothetical protein